jgi:hypothetical protein
VAWIAGVVAVVLYAQTAWANGIVFNDISLADMNFASLLVIGLGIGSVGSVVTDVIQARDNTDSAAVPPLVPKVPQGE